MPTDKERMDWLVKCESIGFASGDREPNSWIAGKRLRAAIDAAIREEKSYNNPTETKENR